MTFWQFCCASAFTSGLLLLGLPVEAQLLPDGTLGDEASVVVPGAEVRGLPAELVEGGALRGGSLFHSFGEFNVDAGQRVYFANPDGVETIFNRVTGRNPSNVFGTLGVDGPASLFLMNPNGILFGPEASLDIEGSFFATTAERLEFGDGQGFSAVEPGPAPILQVAVPLGLQGGPAAKLIDSGVEEFAAAQAGFVAEGAAIRSAGELRVGGDLGLLAEGLNLEGQVVAGGDLVLRGTEGVRIRDSVDEAFVAASRGALLVQGDEVVDIFALNNAGSGLVSGGDMVLRSAQRVGGDAHYFSNNFRIENLDSGLNTLYSPHDPIILARGDISFREYIGASLHILAGGRIFIPENIVITGPDTTGNSLQETIFLSDSTSVSINGSERATVDLRAGIDWEKLGINSFENIGFGLDVPLDAFQDMPTNSNISVGKISRTQGGNLDVYLTNQYFGNSDLPGTIATLGLDSQDVLGGGNLIIDSKDDIFVFEDMNLSSTSIGNFFLGDGGEAKLIANNIFIEGDIISSGRKGGSITLKANQDITIAPNTVFNTQGDERGQIDITGSNLLMLPNSLILSGSASGFQESNSSLNNIQISLEEGLVLNGSFILNSVNQNFALTIENFEDIYNGLDANNLDQKIIDEKGGILINSSQIELTNGARIGANLIGQGYTGNITINADELLSLSGKNSTISSIATSTGVGASGHIIITSPRLLIKQGGSVLSRVVSSSAGNSGNIDISASDANISWENAPEVPTDGTVGRVQGLSGGIIAQSEGLGSSGKLSLTADNLTLRDDALIASNAFNAGDSGEVTINSKDFRIFRGGQVQSATLGNGKIGGIRIDARGNVELSGISRNKNTSSIMVETRGLTGSSPGADLTVEAENLLLKDGGLVSSRTFFNGGDGGNILVDVNDLVLVQGQTPEPVRILGSSFNFSPSAISSETRGKGDAGDLTIESKKLVLKEIGQISAATRFLPDSQKTGDGGDIILDVRESILITDSALTPAQTNTFSGVFSDTASQGDAGSLTVSTDQLEINNGGRLSARASGSSNGLGGNISIRANSASLGEQGTIITRSEGSKNSGSISLALDAFLSLENGEITSSSVRASGSDIEISAQQIRLVGDSDIQTNVEFDDGNGGSIRLIADSILAFDDSDILTFSQDGAGGDITFDTPAFFGENYIPGSPPPFDLNDRVDINASGTVNGVIALPDVTFIQDSLTDLPESILNPDNLVANSCVVRSAQESQGQFLITGTGGLPSRPSDPPTATYTTGTIRSTNTSVAQTSAADSNISGPIEPQGLYRLTNGRLVLSRECDKQPEPVAPS